MTTATWASALLEQVRQIVQRVADELLEVVIVERIQLHELAFLRGRRQSLARQPLGAADDLFELRLGLGIAPARHAHRHERHAAHEGRRDDHPQRDVLERSYHADRTEALPDDEHHQAKRHGHERRHADASKLAGGAWRGRRAHREPLLERGGDHETLDLVGALVDLRERVVLPCHSHW